MNRLWVRISLTFVVIVVFVILIPLLIGLSTGSFGFEHGGEETFLDVAKTGRHFGNQGHFVHL